MLLWQRKNVKVLGIVIISSPGYRKTLTVWQRDARQCHKQSEKSRPKPKPTGK